jgi:CubicO group peptidase (beta-lactamase class C family)
MLVTAAVVAAVMTARPAVADPVDDIISEQTKVSHLPGVAVAIVDDGRVTKLRGYGDANLEWPAKVDPNTKFQLASATKLFTGILLMRSVERGKLSLDDPISKFFPGAPESWASIKVRQLANHTSGLNESLGQPRPKTLADAVAASMKQPLAYQPGTEARYGFTDFTILRAILEKVNGATLPQLLDRELLKPLALIDTGFAMAQDDGPVRTGEVLTRRASVYGWSGDRQRTSEFFFEPLGYGAGGLFSSARDLAKLFAALDRGQIVSPQSLKELTTAATLPAGRKSGFGIGWTVRDYHGVPVVGHSGGPALSDVLRIPSQRRTIIVLTNQQNFYPVLAERIADLTIRVPPLPGGADEKPAIAANLLGLWKALGSGGDDKPFVAKGGDPGAPLRTGFGKALVEAVGPLKRAVLVHAGPDGERIYRLQFERKQWDWAVKADDAGLIADMHPA